MSLNRWFCSGTIFVHLLVTVYCQLLDCKEIFHLEACCNKTLMPFNDSEDTFHYILTDNILCCFFYSDAAFVLLSLNRVNNICTVL